MARGERRLAVLNELTDIGMQLVREVGRQVPAQSEARDPALGRNSLGMRGRLVGRPGTDVLAPGSGGAADCGFGGQDRDGWVCAPSAGFSGYYYVRGAWRTWDGKMKARKRKKVEEAIASGAEPVDAEDLLRDQNKRADDAEYGDEFSDRPIGMAVTYICGALVVEVNLKHFSDAEMGFDTEAIKSTKGGFGRVDGGGFRRLEGWCGAWDGT
jgi:hypothetical protein